MNEYLIAQLAEIRRQELIADATLYGQTKRHRTPPRDQLRIHPRRRLSAFRAWLAAGQL